VVVVVVAIQPVAVVVVVKWPQVLRQQSPVALPRHTQSQWALAAQPTPQAQQAQQAAPAVSWPHVSQQFQQWVVATVDHRHVWAVLVHRVVAVVPSAVLPQLAVPQQVQLAELA
jgi:hypothetical protein